MPIEVKNRMSGIRRDRKSWPAAARKASWLAALISALLTGCTTFPPSPDATVVQSDKVTGAILNELYCAAADMGPGGTDDTSKSYFNSIDHWVALVDLYLSAQIEGTVSPAVSLLGPFNPAKAVPTGGSTGTFTAAFGASFDQTRTNLREYKIYIDMPRFLDPAKGWKKIYQDVNWKTECANPNRYGTYLSGRIGLEAWLKPAARAFMMTKTLAPMTSSSSDSGAPQLNFVYPDRGPAGARVLVVGSNFTKDSTVTFGSASAPTDDMQVSPNLLEVTTPPQPAGTGTVKVKVKGAKTTANYTYCDHCAAVTLTNDVRESAAAAAPGSSDAGKQSPSIGGTFTFVIKSTGTFGPSFLLSRASGGSSTLFNVVRTDNNYVNIVLTPTYYCPDNQDATGKCTVQTVSGRTIKITSTSQVSPEDVAVAVDRADAASLNLNLAHLISP